MEITELLDQAAAANAAVARGVRADQLTNPTPCSEWDVHQLMDHMIGSYTRFAARAAGQPAGPPGQPAVTTGHQDAIDQLVAAANAASAAWHQPGALDRKTASPLGELPGRFGATITLTELAAHGWDLARATGQRLPLEDATAEEILNLAKSVLRPEARQSAFGPERTPPADAPAVDRLAAFLGRATTE
jgi:uncharacterized protein (TIGR03086 family)